MENGIRHLVAVSIVDNSAQVNANVATRFARTDGGIKTQGSITLFGYTIAK